MDFDNNNLQSHNEVATQLSKIVFFLSLNWNFKIQKMIACNSDSMKNSFFNCFVITCKYTQLQNYRCHTWYLTSVRDVYV